MNQKQAEHDRTVLPRIQALLAQGRSRREIAAQLQHDGVPTARRGGKWTHIAVGRILDRADRPQPEEASPPPPLPEPPPAQAEPSPAPAEPPPAPAPQLQQIEEQLGSVVDQLSARIQEREEQLGNAVDQMNARVLDKLGTIESQLQTQVAAVSRLSTWLWLRPVAVGVAICLAVGGAGWGYLTWLEARIESQRQTLTEGKQDIERQQATVRELKQDTWGVGLHEETDGRFLILPENTAKRWWNLGDKPAVKLPDK